MTTKPAQGNIVTAIRAMQQGARVFASGDVEIFLSVTEPWVRIGSPFGPLLAIGPADIVDVAYAIKWPKPRTPKRGEYWGRTGENLILQRLSSGFFVVRWPSGKVDVTSVQDDWIFKRKATPEEMAKFDGGDVE
jgi:hypothetical protein